jgi:hypothetical protein
MDDDASKEPPAADFNKLDLSQLQGFSFGTQWTQDKATPGDRRERSERPRREDRGEAPGGAPDRRDRRAFQRPMGDGPGAPPREGGAPGPRRDAAPDDRGPRRDPGDARGGMRRSAPGGDWAERGPYDSPYFSAVFYPEDASFNALVKTIRTSARTIELFEIARTVLGKSDRFVVVVARRGGPADGAEAPAPPPPVYLSVPDGLPFESEEAATAHVWHQHLGQFFDTAEVEVEPPKGNFQAVNRCGVTGELLAPPNYHRYLQIAQQHHAKNLAGRMSFEAFRARIESVRDPAVIAQWLEKMKRVQRFTWKAAPVEGQVAPAFDSAEEARSHLLAQARDQVVRAVDSVRFHGKAIALLPPGEIRRAVEGALERQLRFPLDTANVLRGRLRREHFTIFKKGSKGVSYVCAVKRKFRVPGQVFSDSIGALIGFIEAHPMVKAGELGAKFLGIEPPGEGGVLPAAAREQMARTQGDLVWLVREGYVTEFIDGGLYAAPPMAEARKKEVEASDHDPENFPEAPRAAETAHREPAPAEPAAVPAAPGPAPGAEAVAPADSSPKSDAAATVEPPPVADEAPIPAAAIPAPAEPLSPA